MVYGYSGKTFTSNISSRNQPKFPRISQAQNKAQNPINLYHHLPINLLSSSARLHNQEKCAARKTQLFVSDANSIHLSSTPLK